MPANLTPAYFEAEKRYRAAESPDEKIAALNEMLQVMPRHKGTDGLRADLRGKIAKLQKEAAKQPSTSRKGGMYHIPKEGAGQIALMGLTNAGKSQLLSAVTSATPEVAGYPYTTRNPQLGMMMFENVQIQLVDMPPISDRDARPWFATLLRAADVLMLVVDLEIDPVAEVQEILDELAAYRMGCEGIADVSDEIGFHKKAVIVGAKADLDPSGENAASLKATYEDRVPVVIVSANAGTGFEALGRKAFEALGVIRVFTKSPGTQADMNDPMVIQAGSTLEEAAEAVHKDFRRNLKYALIWGSGKFPGQRIKKDHLVQDGDILELHT